MKNNDERASGDIVFKDYIDFNAKMLRYMGLVVRVEGNKRDRRSKILERLPTFISNLTCVLFAISQLLWIIDLWADDKDLATQITATGISNIVCICKGFRLAYCREDLQSMFERLDDIWKRAQPRVEIKENILKKAHNALVFCKWYLIMMVILSIGFGVSPVKDFFLQYLSREQLNHTYDYSKRVFLGRYPFEIKSTKIYFIVLLEEEYLLFCSALYWVCCDTLFAQLTTFTSLQFEISFKFFFGSGDKYILWSGAFFIFFRGAYAIFLNSGIRRSFSMPVRKGNEKMNFSSILGVVGDKLQHREIMFPLRDIKYFYFPLLKISEIKYFSPLKRVLWTLQVLYHDIETVVNLEKDESRLQTKVCDFIKRHQDLLRICQMIEYIFSPVLFTTMLFTSINICVNVFELREMVSDGKIVDAAVHCFHLINIFFQLLVYCVFAERLTQQTNSIANAMYNCIWTEKNVKLRVYLRIIIMKSQESFYCTAYGFFTIGHYRITIFYKYAKSRANQNLSIWYYRLPKLEANCSSFIRLKSLRILKSLRNAKLQLVTVYIVNRALSFYMMLQTTS